MRKARKYSLPKVSADAVAQNLKRGMGRDRAFKVADALAHNLNKVGPEDFNHQIFELKDIRKGERFWTQVRNILAK